MTVKPDGCDQFSRDASTDAYDASKPCKQVLHSAAPSIM